MYYLVNVDQNSMAAHISPVMTMMGVKCCTSNAVDGTDDMWWNGSEEGGNVRGECEEDAGTDCEDGQSDTDW